MACSGDFYSMGDVDGGQAVRDYRRPRSRRGEHRRAFREIATVVVRCGSVGVRTRPRGGGRGFQRGSVLPLARHGVELGCRCREAPVFQECGQRSGHLPCVQERLNSLQIKPAARRQRDCSLPSTLGRIDPLRQEWSSHPSRRRDARQIAGQPMTCTSIKRTRWASRTRREPRPSGAGSLTRSRGDDDAPRDPRPRGSEYQSVRPGSFGGSCASADETLTGREDRRPSD